jgi:hypothetical protein
MGATLEESFRIDKGRSDPLSAYRKIRTLFVKNAITGKKLNYERIFNPTKLPEIVYSGQIDYFYPDPNLPMADL